MCQSHVSCAEEMQQLLFADPTQWWDARLCKPHPDFTHKKSKVVLWVNTQHKPAWVDSHPAMCDAGMTNPFEPTIQGPGTVGRDSADDKQLEVSMSRKLCEDGLVTDAVDELNLLLQKGSHAPINLFYRLLRRCKACKDLALGRRIHSLIVKTGYEGDVYLATHLIGMYANHGRLKEAMRVFADVSTPDAYTWATIIFAYARHGEAARAIQLYRHMRRSSTVMPTDRVYVAVLKACAAAGDLVTGKEVHAHVLASLGQPNIFVQNGLINMYAKCSSLEDARIVFDRVPERNVVTWNSMFAAYSQQGMGQDSLRLYTAMQQDGIIPNSVTYVCLLQACSCVGVGALILGKQLHAEIQERGLQDDVVLGCSLVNMYAKCGSLQYARRLFDILTYRDVVTWTAMIAGYTQRGMGQEALNLYSRMRQEGVIPPNSLSYACLLQACASVGIGALRQGKQLHSEIHKRGLQDDMVLGCSLVDMYAKCGSLEEARSVFDTFPARNVVMWTAMIAGYSQQGMVQKALSLYYTMQQEGLIPPNAVSFVCLLQACASEGLGALHVGKQVHAHIEDLGLQDDVTLGSSLVNMYAKCGSLKDARHVFDRLPDKDVVTWTAMISGYAQQGMGQEALGLYNCMQQEGLIRPNSFSYTCALQACAIVAALPLGKQLHSQIKEQGLQGDVVVGAALVNMYSKCGSMLDAQLVFDSLAERTIEAWGALAAGYTLQGDSEVVFNLLDRMRSEGLQPNGIMFLSVLTVCSHVGLVERGRKYFAAMRTDYGIDPTIEHYVCLMDLLGRAGLLEEALQVAKTMPFLPNSVVWHTLLGACRMWNNVEIGQQAFESAVSMDGGYSSSLCPDVQHLLMPSHVGDG